MFALTNVLGILDTSAHLGRIIGTREDVFLPSKGAKVSVEDLWQR